MTQPIGILGGTFDPVHNGHIHLAETCFRELDLTELRFIPLNNPPHRRAPQASAEQRLQMLNLVLEKYAHIKVDDCELQRDEVSYTIDTLKLLREKVGDMPLCMLIGMDNFETLNTWHQWQLLLDYTHIVIAHRPGGVVVLSDEMQTFMDTYQTGLVSDLHQQTAGLILQLDIPMLNISSTQIRNNFRTHLNSDSLLPEIVLNFIQTHDLYK